MRDLEVRRPGPMTPFELQLRRVATRAAFLALELEKLEEHLAAGARSSADQADAVSASLEPIVDRMHAIATLLRR